MWRFSKSILAVVLVLAGCAQKPAAIAPVASSTLATTEAQALCLAVAGGTTPIEHDLARAQSLARQRPDRADAWVAAGRGWVRKARLSADPGFYVNVDGCASEALRANPDFVPALELRSLVLMNNHQFEQARALAEKILTRAPDSVIADGTLSDALLELGRYPEAARAAQAQMNAQPGMAADTLAAHLNWLKGDSRSAKLFIRDALLDRNAADPEAAAWTFVEAGMIYWHEGDYAGADAIFPEALTTADMFKDVAARLPGVPLLANMTEFGRTPFFTASEFEAMGYKMVIWPVSSLRVANKASDELYKAIKRDGGTYSMIDRMQTRAELYATIGYHDYEALDASIVTTIIPQAMAQRG